MKFKHTQAEARALWIQALRSGEYKQTDGRLCEVDDGAEDPNPSYCCLCVACEVFITAEPDMQMVVEDKEHVRHFNGSYATLPLDVKNWLGMIDSAGEYGDSEDEDWDPDTSLAQDNDSHGLTFNEIAAIIEGEPEGMFE